MQNLINNALLILKKIRAVIFCYYKERDNYIREREKYIALKLLDEYGWEPFEERCSSSSYLKDLLEQMSPCMSKLDPQCSFFCKNYYNCIGDENGKN